MPTNLSASETYRSKYGDAPKLNTTNYHAWSTALMYILRAAQAWRIVIGEEQPPEAPRNTASAIQERYEEKRDKFNVRYDIAAATLYHSCTSTVQPYITGDSNPATI